MPVTEGAARLWTFLLLYCAADVAVTVLNSQSQLVDRLNPSARNAHEGVTVAVVFRKAEHMDSLSE